MSQLTIFHGRMGLPRLNQYQAIMCLAQRHKVKSQESSTLPISMHLQENTLFDFDLGVKIHYLSQGHTKCCPVPSTSCDLCTCKV